MKQHPVGILIGLILWFIIGAAAGLAVAALCAQDFTFDWFYVVAAIIGGMAAVIMKESFLKFFGQSVDEDSWDGP